MVVGVEDDHGGPIPVQDNHLFVVGHGLRGGKHDPSSSGARIHVVQASKHSSSGDRSVAGQGSRKGALEGEAPMGAVEVAVLGELDQNGAEVSLIDDDQVIRALSADRASEPLGDRIRARARKGVLTLVMPRETD